MTETDLKERLTYFEKRLAEAQRMYAARETLPLKFSLGFTTEKLKTWPDTIKVIKERITTVKDQIDSQYLERQ
jgi:hypothetical protein